MSVKVSMKTDFEIELLLCKPAMPDSVVLMDELDREYRPVGVGRYCFLDTDLYVRPYILTQRAFGKPNQPCVCTLPNSFRNDAEWQLAG